MKKIVIIGCCGGGKSVLAKRLSAILNIPSYCLDDLFWHKDWVTTPKDQWASIVTELAQKDSWIIDGTYSATLDIRLKYADTVFFLDLPTWFCLYRITKRALRNYLGLEKTMPYRIQQALKTSRQSFLSDWSFYKYVYNFKRDNNPQIQKHLRSLRQDQQLIHLKSANQTKTWLKQFTCH